MFAIAILSCIMFIVAFVSIIYLLAERTPVRKVPLVFATLGFLVTGAAFVTSALLTELPCDSAEQRVTQGDNSYCIPDYMVLDYMESNK